MNDRLSNIVDEMAKGSMSELMSRPVRVAIAQKYQEMESVLQTIADQGSSDPLAHSRVDACAALALTALRFDPLA